MTSPLPDPSTPFGERVARRLRDERVIWLTSVAADGTPQPNPVWFLWENGTILVYNQPGARRLAHIQRNPRVALNFDSADGEDVVVITGTARVDPAAPPADQVAEYVAKYRESIPEIGHDPHSLAAEYSVALRITPERVRGF